MTMVGSRQLGTKELRRGDLVRLKSFDDIAATLAEDGTLDALPFMEEMLQFAGNPLVVEARADKTCDTIDNTGPTRRMTGTVHLQGARCDGSRHGGCQAYCLLFFKEEWLERVPDSEAGPAAVAAARAVTTPTPGAADEICQTGLAHDGAETDPGALSRIQRFAHRGPDIYRCQATELLRASSKLTGYGHYLDDLRTHNVSVGRFVHAIPFTVVNKLQRHSESLPARFRLFNAHRFPRVRGSVRNGDFPAPEPLGLQAGDIVEVRSRKEIEATLDENQRNRGLWFDEEMLVHCGRRGRVLARVERLIDERTGRMLKIRKDTVIVEGMVGCAGVYHNLCPRAVIAFWREAWLRKV